MKNAFNSTKESIRIRMTRVIKSIFWERHSNNGAKFTT